MSMIKQGMECVGLSWNEKKCAVAHVRRGIFDQDAGNMEIDNLKRISNLSEDITYKFLGVLENSKQEDKPVLEDASKAYFNRGFPSYGRVHYTFNTTAAHSAVWLVTEADLRSGMFAF